MKNIVFFECRGGSDKGADGHRRDTKPMINSLKEKGWDAEAVFYSDEESDDIFERTRKTAAGYVSRINPGNIPSGEEKYFGMLRQLCDVGVVGFPHPDAMSGFGAKDSLVKLADTNLVPSDTYAYYAVEEFKKSFPLSLSYGERVLKQNRGSTGEGIWRVEVLGDKLPPGQSYPLDTRLKCTEAVDNKVETWPLGEFMDFCKQYILGKNGQLVDMRFFPRIKEGEIRILLVGPKPVFVVHKKPAETADAFSATLFSGAKYTYDSPDKWKALINFFNSHLNEMVKKLGGYDIPLLWTADFMLDTGKNGEDLYVLGEINCSCVGFTSHLDMGIQDLVADQIITTVMAKRNV